MSFYEILPPISEGEIRKNGQEIRELGRIGQIKKQQQILCFSLRKTHIVLVDQLLQCAMLANHRICEH